MADKFSFSAYGGGNSEMHVFRPQGKERPYSIAFLHGFGRDAGFYEDVGNEFSERGVETYMPDMRGHGTSGDKFDIHDMLADALLLGEHVKRSGKKIVFAGHSMGGYLALLAQAYDKTHTVDGVVAVAAPRNLAKYTYRYPGWKLLKLPGIKRVMKSPAGKIISSAVDSRIEVAGDRIKFGKLLIDEPRDFAGQIENSPDVVAGYRNGFDVKVPVMVVYDRSDPHNDYNDSMEILDALKMSVNGNGVQIAGAEIPGMDVGLSKRVVGEIADVSLGFLEGCVEA